jgi:hypothetical protein
MTTWMPIETAPKDGTPILARTGWYGHPFVVFWSAPCIEFGPMPALPEGSVITRDWMLSNSEDGQVLYAPTEWQPIP